MYVVTSHELHSKEAVSRYQESAPGPEPMANGQGYNWGNDKPCNSHEGMTSGNVKGTWVAPASFPRRDCRCCSFIVFVIPFYS
jgi:hypothetical protein